MKKLHYYSQHRFISKFFLLIRGISKLVSWKSRILRQICCVIRVLTLLKKMLNCVEYGHRFEIFVLPFWWREFLSYSRSNWLCYLSGNSFICLCCIVIFFRFCLSTSNVTLIKSVNFQLRWSDFLGMEQWILALIA